MFDTNEDFDIDEDFLQLGSHSSQIISSTPLSPPSSSNNSQSNKVPSPKNNVISSNSQKQNNSKISIFESDELLDENFLDTEFEIEDEIGTKIQKQLSANGTKRPFSEILNNQNKKICVSNSGESGKHVETILNIVKNTSSPTESVSFGKTGADKRIFKFPLKENRNDKVINNFKQKSDNEPSIAANTEKIIPKLNTVVRRRKFPGPAGLLPEINSIEEATKIKLHDLEDSPTDTASPLITICSQDTVSKFHQGPWKQMLQDYDTDLDNNNSLPRKYTISWLKNVANVKGLNQRKVPFLAAIVDSVNTISEDSAVKLKDETGEIDGVIDKETWEEFNHVLIIGSVIVLHQVGVLTFSLKKHYLNITSNNIVVVYSPNELSSDVRITKGPNFLNCIELSESILRQQQSHSSAQSVNPSKNKSSFANFINSNKPPHLIKAQLNPKPSSSNNNFANSVLPSTSRCNFNSTPGNINSVGTSPRPTLSNENKPKFNNNFANSVLPSTSRCNFNSTPGNINSIETSPRPTLSNENKPKFNFVKSKLSKFTFKPRDKTEEKVSSNSSATNNSEDIESIINSTFAGIDADSFFDEF